MMFQFLITNKTVQYTSTHHALTLLRGSLRKISFFVQQLFESMHIHYLYTFCTETFSNNIISMSRFRAVDTFRKMLSGVHPSGGGEFQVLAKLGQGSDTDFLGSFIYGYMNSESYQHHLFIYLKIHCPTGINQLQGRK